MIQVARGVNSPLCKFERERHCKLLIGSSKKNAVSRRHRAQPHLASLIAVKSGGHADDRIYIFKNWRVGGDAGRRIFSDIVTGKSNNWFPMEHDRDWETRHNLRRG
jgi:hypothetical protein